ncbi:MAG: YggS family pyridoxal phosphate-dependent enzyme [Gemmataceae bacterium]
MEEILRANLQRVRERIAAACRRANRSPDEVTLVAVTKYIPASVAALLYQLGQADLGESRPQELWHKAAHLPHARWHLVGHLQRNKVAKTLPLVWLIHSVDSVRLLDCLEREAARAGSEVHVLLELNLTGEATKHGFTIEGAEEVLEDPLRWPHVRMYGLMTMAQVTSDPETTRPVFRRLRELRDAWRSRVPPPHCLTELSMGMSQDYEVAIEEGATLVRIGSALYEGIGELAHD